ncbi:hypothetical protein [Chitinophaga jiangningensis]|nr:hypothetical protein [Chitinophaga jiangningensis]
MLRTIIFSAILMSAMAVKAQLPVFPGDQHNSAFAPGNQEKDSSHIQKKWFVTKYTGLSAGFVGFKGGSGTYLSAPMAIQLNRQLTPNLFAFGSLSATPTVMRFSGPAYQPLYKNSGNMQMNSSGIFPAARAGVMYISNDRTFSVSGSVSVSRSNYYGYSPLYNPANSFMQY